jgi:DNA-3-methyladenine glycosylase II
MTSTPTRTFEIQPLGPYSLEESAGFIGGWVPPSEEGQAGQGHLHLAFRSDDNGHAIGVCLRQSRDSRVLGEVFGQAHAGAVRAQVARILSLDVDAREWPEVGRRDPVVAMLQEMFPGFRPVLWSNAYEAAAWCLISARVPMRQSAQVKDRLCRELGDEVDIHGQRMWVFPPPQRLAGMEAFRGLFGRKVEYLNRLAEATLQGRLDPETLRRLPQAEALERLNSLTGIGEFGAQLVRLRALGATDELPTQERRLMSAVRVAYALPSDPDQAELERLAQAWSPFATWVCVCLRRTLGGGAGMAHSRASG